MLIHTGLFSNVSGLGLGLIHCGLGLEKFFWPRPRPHSFWPRPHAQLASLTSLPSTRFSSGTLRSVIEYGLPLPLLYIAHCRSMHTFDVVRLTKFAAHTQALSKLTCLCILGIANVLSLPRVADNSSIIIIRLSPTCTFSEHRPSSDVLFVKILRFLSLYSSLSIRA